MDKREQRRRLAAQRSHLEGRILKLDDEIRCAERNAGVCRKLEKLPEAQRRALLEGSWSAPFAEERARQDREADKLFAQFVAAGYSTSEAAKRACIPELPPLAETPKLGRAPVPANDSLCSQCGASLWWCLCD